jgi:hypothetical protein
MGLDKSIIENLIQNKTRMVELMVQEKKFSIDSSDLSYSDVPVNQPTTRGGVYFSDTMAFKARIMIKDPTISKSLSKVMLGPNTEFAKIQLIPDGDASVQIFANLTNYVQKSNGVELNLVVVETLSAK